MKLTALINPKIWLELALAAALVGLNLLDVYTTLKVLSQGGREINPVMAKLMHALGAVPALALTKAVVLGLVYWQLEAIPFWLLALLVGLYAAVVAHNIKQFK